MKTFVYVMQAASGPVKIGISDDLVRRLCGVQTGNHEKVALLVAVPGGRKQEMALHRALRRDRIHREWFRWSPYTEAVVKWLQAGASISAIVETIEDTTRLFKQVEEIFGMQKAKRRFRSHRLESAYGYHYRRECSLIIQEIDARLDAMPEKAKLAERALRVAAKARAVAR